MTNDVNEEISAIRRSVRRIEDEVADIEREKAGHDDVKPLAAKQSDMDGYVRQRFASLDAGMDEMRRILKAVSESLVSIDEKVTKNKRESDNELQAIKAPEVIEQKRGRGMPVQWQAMLYILAGVGLLALLQGAPQALLQVFPRLALTGVP